MTCSPRFLEEMSITIEKVVITELRERTFLRRAPHAFARTRPA